MLLSRENQEKFVQKMAGLSQSQANLYIMNSSVRLFGNSLTQSDFTGSGVMAYSAKGETTIVTAKHNLSTFGDLTDPATMDTSLIDAFKNKIRIYWDAPMEFNLRPKRSAGISEIIPIIPDAQRPWEYDVIILKSRDPDLAIRAQIWSVYSPSYNPLDSIYLSDQRQYLGRKDKAKRDQLFIQTGFGAVREKAEDGKNTVMPVAKNIGENTEGCLQFRVCEPKAEETVTVYAERTKRPPNYDAVTHAIQLSADATNSTAPGDSGGPLFVVSGFGTARLRLYLIGTSYGADLSTAQERCPPRGELRVNNISTSLEYCYTNYILTLDDDGS